MKLDDKMSPEIKILLYTIVDGEIVADSLSLELNKCLTHKVIQLIHNWTQSEFS